MLAARLGQQAKQLEGDGCADERRAAGLVERRRDFHHVRTDEVEVTEAAVNLLTEKGFNTAYGARFLKRHIDEQVKLPITGMWKQASSFRVDVENGETVVKPNGGGIPKLN